MNPPPWRHSASFYPGWTGPHLFLFSDKAPSLSLTQSPSSRPDFPTAPLVEAGRPLVNGPSFRPAEAFITLTTNKARRWRLPRPGLRSTAPCVGQKKTRNVRILPSGERSGEEPSEGEGAERKEFGRVGDVRGGYLLQRLEGLTFLLSFLLIPKIAKLLFATRQAGRYTNFSSSAFYRKGTDSAPVKVKE